MPAERRSAPLRADEGPDPSQLVLPRGVTSDRWEPDGSLGVPGRPLDRRNPFVIGLTGGLGVAVAYVVVRGIADIASVLVVIGLALFVAVGLNPVIERLVDRGMTRALAAAAVTAGFLAAAAGFVLAALGPMSHEIHAMVVGFPRYEADVESGRGWLGKLVVHLHLVGAVRRVTRLRLSLAGGVLGAGKVILSLGVATVSVVVLTIYFLVALPGVKDLWLSLIPRSRRDRVEVLTDEVFDRVGGFMLGNLLTSVIAGAGTYVWLLAFGVPDPLLLALFVAVLDLVPMVGSTVAGVVVSLVAVTRGLPIGIGTAAYYGVYRFLEDYLLNPRVMRHTVKVKPGLTIVATLVGGTLLGIVGALVAIPVAATIQLLLEQVAFPRQDTR